MKNNNKNGKKKYNRETILKVYRGSIAHNLYVAPEEDEIFGTCDVDFLDIYKYPEEYYLTLEAYRKPKRKEQYESFIDENDIDKAFEFKGVNGEEFALYVYVRKALKIIKNRCIKKKLDNKNNI